jgi:hypothetical protein
VRAGVLWVGTDDGNLQVTRDDGKTWTNVAGKVPGLKKGAYVAKVEASHRDEGTAYVAFDNHRSDDFAIYLYMTTDYGQTWRRITDGIPEEAGSAHVVREDPRNPNLLFAGTEFGLFVSFDRGGKWEKMRNGLPTVPVFDIAIHPRDHDLILGTHGRSILIMDDITALEQMSDSVLSADWHLFDMRAGTSFHIANFKGFTGTREFIAANPPYGVVIDYYLKNKLEGRNPVKITVTDKAGNKIRELNGSGEPGINRVNWDLRYDAPAQPPPANPAASGAQPGENAEPEAAGGGGRGGGGGGGPFGFGGNRGPLVDPGEYDVAIAAAGKNETKTVAVEEDPRITLSAADRAKRRQALTKLYGMAREAETGRRRIVAMRTSLTTLTDSWKRPGATQPSDSVKKAAEDLLVRVKEVAGLFEVDRQGGLGFAGPPLTYTPPPVNQKIGRLMGAIDGYAAAPTERQFTDIDQASAELGPALASVNKLANEEVPRLNKMMADAGVPYVNTGPASR